MYDLQIFPTTLWAVFTVLMVSFEAQKVLIFMKSNLCFSFVVHAFRIITEFLTKPSHEDLVLCFLLRVL